MLGFRNILGEKRIDALLKDLILLGITFVVLLMIGEFAMRLIFRDITTTADNTSYFAKRWKDSNVYLNKWGFREREFALEKPDGIYRIAVIGDSLTYGQGIAEDDRFTNLLEKYLRENGNYEVLNFGKAGAETIDHISFLKDLVLKTSPDFIILQWYINDFEGHDKKDRPKNRPLIPFKKLRRKLHQSSAMYYLINLQWDLLQSKLDSSKISYREYMYQRFGNSESAETQKALHSLKSFINLCKRYEIPLGIVLFPSFCNNLGEDYPYNFLHNYVHEVCSQEGINYIDLRSDYDQVTDYKKLKANRFDGHPGPLANSIAVKRLIDTFDHIWLSDAID